MLSTAVFSRTVSPAIGTLLSHFPSAGEAAPARPFQLATPPETCAGGGRRTLVLVAKRSQNHRPDFERMARYIRQIAPDIRPIVTADRLYDILRPALWLRPTLVFSPVRLRRFRALHGPVFHGHPPTQSQELERLQTQGIPVPRWAVLTQTRTLDLNEFGSNPAGDCT